ncbi:MrpH family fimbial adhesin [Rahnella victoriana]|uniref:MrpH family fimbial adhesin n=1 Tax=Rahnella victoriana TaxID=1510570 RepID=UPI000F4E9BDD|nr:hypothetical protein [Rahnella victoriana]
MKRYCKWLAVIQCMVALLYSGSLHAVTLQVNATEPVGNSTLISYQASGPASTTPNVGDTNCQFAGAKCHFQIYASRSENGLSPKAITDRIPQYIEVANGVYKSWEELGNLYVAKYGAKGSFTVPIAITQCLRFGFYNGYNRPQLMPGTTCTAPTGVTAVCDFATSVENIDHGTLTSDAIPDNTKSITVSSSCLGGSAKIIVHATDDSGVTMKNGEIKSVLTFDDKALGSVIDIAEGTSSHTITSKLSALKTVTAGTFTASTVLTMTVQ